MRANPHELRYAWFVGLIALLTTTLACNASHLGNPEEQGSQATYPPTTSISRPTLTPGPTPTPQPTLSAPSDDFTAFEYAMRPEYAEDLKQYPVAARYSLDVTISFKDDNSVTLIGRELIHYTNRQTLALDSLVLMLWPNAEHQYLSDMTLESVRVDGQERSFDLEQKGLVARIPLSPPLAPGESVEVGAKFVVAAFPVTEGDRSARFGVVQNVLLAPTFYPLIPHLTPEGVWQTHPASPGGSATNSDSALYVWRVSAPAQAPWGGASGADLAIVGTGSVIETAQAGGLQTQTFVTGPMRDLALVVGPFERTQRIVDGIVLNAYVLADQAGRAEAILNYAQGQLTHLQAVVGPYPFRELDLPHVPGIQGGMEYPGVALIGSVSEAYFFEVTVAHEVGHQWFYGLVGSDPVSEPWLDESAASYTEVLYAEAVYGLEAAAERLRQAQDFVRFADHPAWPIGWPTEAYGWENDYGIILYMKGKLFFDALRRQLGDETFFAFLRHYNTVYRYGFATAADFQAAAESTCACDLDDLFNLWVYEGGSVKP